MSDPLTNSPADVKADADSKGPLDPTQGLPTEPQFAAPAHAGEVGTFGRYRVLEKLGQGGMGAVYLGYDDALDRKVALKVMLPQYAADADSRERFLREARSAAKVRSDHVVTIFDVGEERTGAGSAGRATSSNERTGAGAAGRAARSDERGAPFIAMEYLLGSPLDKFLKTKGELPLVQVLRIARETALGLAAAHALGMVHRDVKPGNVWLEAPKGRVKLLDFGLARADSDEQLTGSGAVVGTPAYMSPEQGRGQKLDARSDLFSLGVMLYRLCTGRLPFTGQGAMAVLTSLAVDTPPEPRALNPELPEAVETLITKLLAKKPDERFQTAREVIDAITAIETAPSGELPRVVVVSVPQLTVGAQTQNVWEGIEDSGSVAVPLATTAAEVPPKPPAPRRGTRWPLALAAVAVLAAVGAVAAAVLWPKKKPEVAQVDGPAPGAPNPTRPDPVPVPEPKKGPFQPLGKKYDLPPDLVAAVAPVRPAKVATLEHLDPGRHVPPEERFAWQPKELVAVMGSHRQRMTGMLFHVGFGADGKTAFAAVAASNGSVVEAFDAESGARTNLPPWTCMSPDGTRAAAGKRVWDVADPTAVPAEYPSLQGTIVALLAPDRALVQLNSELTVWALGPKPEPRGKGVAAGLFAVAPDGKRLVAVPKGGGSCAVYDLTADGPRSKYALNGPNGELKAAGTDGNRLSLSSAGTLAVANPDRPVQVWNVSGDAPRLRHAVGGAPGWYHIAFLADGLRLAITDGQTIELWTVEGNLPRKLSAVTDLGLAGSNIRAMAAAPTGAAVVTGHLHGAVRLWGVTAEGVLFERNPVRAQPTLATGAALSPDGRFAALPHEDGRFHLWDLEKWAAVPLDGKGTGAAFTPDGAELAAHVSGKLGAGAPGAAARREFGAGHWPGAYSPDGKLLAAVSGTEMVLWDVSAAPRERGRVQVGWFPQVVRFSADGRFVTAARVAANADPGAFRVWALTAGGLAVRQEGAFPYPCGHFALAPDGGAALLCRAGGGLAFCEVRDGLIGEPREDKLSAMWAEYSPDGRTLLTGNAVGVKVVAADTLAVLWEMPSRGISPGARWHPDGRHVLVTNPDRTTYVLRLDLDADRTGAAWVLSVGGAVQVNSKPGNYTAKTPLPAERFALTSVALATRAVTADGLANLRGCTRLRFLALNTTQTNDAGLAHLAGCTVLMQANLNDTKITDEGLASVRGWTQLANLHLAGTKITDKGLVHLKELKSLAHLSLARTGVTADGVADLAKSLPNCTISWNGGIVGLDSERRGAEKIAPHAELTLLLEDGTTATVKPKGALPKEPFAVTEITLPNARLDANFADSTLLPAVAYFRALEGIWKRANPLAMTDKHLDRMAELPVAGTLTALSNVGLELTPKTLDALKKFPQLSRLGCAANTADDAVLERLSELPGLTEELRLYALGRSGKVTAKGLSAVLKLPVRRLRLGQSPAVGEFIRLMPGALKAGEVTFYECTLTADDLAALAKCGSLVSLSLATSKGVTDDTVGPLAGMSGLKYLDLSGTAVTAAKVAELKKAMPNCEIVRDETEKK